MATTGLTGWEVVADGAVSSGAVSSGAVTAVTVYEDGAGVGDARGFERALFGAQLVRAAVSAESQRRVVWQELIADWLTLKASRSGSAHTRRNYEAAVLRWQEFLATQFVDDPDGAVRTCEMWEVDHGHVRGWQAALAAEGLGESSVNHQLSCVSSFYSFVINEKRMVNGVELDLFVDRLGRARVNPFKAGNLQRARTKSYERANPLSVPEYVTLLRWLESQAHTVAGARNHALILTYLHTGWRSAELLRMRWEDVRPSTVQPGTFVFAWRGKGGKTADDVLPADCYHAIVAFLRKAGRWTPGAPGREEGLAPDEFVWLPVREADMSGMRNGAQVDMARPISEKSALGVLRVALRKAGIRDAATRRVHDLRHTHAHLLLETKQNLALIQARLHHSSLATTGLYVKAITREDPIDTFTAGFQQLRMGV
jgi:site-specific recombinase XerD